jgi:molecular chaperone GrpE
MSGTGPVACLDLDRTTIYSAAALRLRGPDHEAPAAIDTAADQAPEGSDRLLRVADLSLQDLADKVDDLARVVFRQAATLERLADGAARPGPDVPLLVELHALRAEALACAAAGRTRKDRSAFGAIAAGLERLLAGRGGTLVTPRPGHAFSAATMAAAEDVATDDAALDRTVATLLEPGLEVEGRSVRPARVAVHRHRAPEQPPDTGENTGGPAGDAAEDG